MKEYKNFMDGVKAPNTLRQRLAELEAPEKRPIPWRRYGAMAAALALVCGLGGLGAWAAWGNGLNNPVPTYPAGYQGSQPENIDIALVEPGEDVEPGQRTLGGYDVTENGMVVHYVLPYIDYGDTGLSEVQTALDWDIPQGAFRRDMSREHIAYLLGGEDAVSTHLDWDGYELSGWAAWYENGDFWGAYVMGHQGPLDHFEFAVTADQLPPTCIAYPHSVEQNICGVMVTADGHDSVATPSGGVDASTRRALAEERVSRLVRLVADDGTRYLEWITDTMEPVMTANGDGTVTCTVCGETFPDRTHGDGSLCKYESETTICSICGQQVLAGGEKAHVHSFPGVGEPNWDDGAPAVSAQPSYTCPECGEESVPGSAHGHGICGLPLASTPGVNTCPDCGVSYPAGEAHDHTYTCPECGEMVPEGQSHHHSCETDPACVCEVCGAEVPEGTDHSHTCGVCGQAVQLGASHSHTCGVCGQTVQLGASHSHTCGVCGQAVQVGASHSHTCATCGQTVNTGDHHSHGVCGLPLAPDTQTCPNCGVTYTTGTGHTCRQGGHHHGGHH